MNEMTNNKLEATSFLECVCLKLRKGARRTTNIYDAFLEPAGLRITQFGLLGHLELHAEPMSIGALADALDLDPTTLYRNLKPLEKKKLLKISANARDRRAKEISITSAGRNLLWQAAPLWKAAQDHLLETVGEKQTQALSKMLDLSLTRLNKS